MKLPRKLLCGTSAMLACAIATPASAGFTNFGVDRVPGPPPWVQQITPADIPEPEIPEAQLAEEGIEEILDTLSKIDPPPFDPETGGLPPSGEILPTLELIASEPQVTQVPEPASLALVLLGLGGLVWRRRASVRNR